VTVSYQSKSNVKRLMNQNPKVSVIIPVFNREKLIQRSINSILNQTYKNFEVIVIDDASTDNTSENIAQLKDKRLRHFKNDINLGPSKSRNKGIELSTGELIAFQDSDDEWYSDKLEKQVDLFFRSGEETGAVYCGMEFIDYKTRKKIGESIDKSDFKKNFISGSFFRSPANVSLIIPKNVLNDIGGFDERLFAHEDTELAIRITKKYDFALIDEVLVRVTRNHNQLMANTFNYIRALEIIYEKHKDYLSRKILVGLCKQIANYYILTDNIDKAKSAVKCSLKYKPRDFNMMLEFIKTMSQFFLLHTFPNFLKKLYKRKYRGEIPLLSGLSKI